MFSFVECTFLRWKTSHMCAGLMRPSGLFNFNFLLRLPSLNFWKINLVIWILDPLNSTWNFQFHLSKKKLSISTSFCTLVCQSLHGLMIGCKLSWVHPCYHKTLWCILEWSHKNSGRKSSRRVSSFISNWWKNSSPVLIVRSDSTKLAFWFSIIINQYNNCSSVLIVAII